MFCIQVVISGVLKGYVHSARGPNHYPMGLYVFKAKMFSLLGLSFKSLSLLSFKSLLLLSFKSLLLLSFRSLLLLSFKSLLLLSFKSLLQLE
jgi:hypothetical protein